MGLYSVSHPSSVVSSVLDLLRDFVVVRPDNIVIQCVHSPHNSEKLSQGTGLKIAPGPDSLD